MNRKTCIYCRILAICGMLVFIILRLKMPSATVTKLESVPSVLFLQSHRLLCGVCYGVYNQDRTFCSKQELSDQCQTAATTPYLWRLRPLLCSGFGSDSGTVDTNDVEGIAFLPRYEYDQFRNVMSATAAVGYSLGGNAMSGVAAVGYSLGRNGSGIQIGPNMESCACQWQTKL